MVQEKYREKRPVTRDDNTNNNNNKCTVKTKVIPVTIEATGTIPESFRKFLSNIPGKHKINELQKSLTVHLTHTLDSPNVNVQNICKMQNNITCNTNCKYRTATTLHILETLFV